MDLIFNIELFDEVEELEIIEFGIPRMIYTRSDHYNNMPDYTFFKRFRLTKETVITLLPLLEEQLEFAIDINQCVSPMNQLLTCLRYYATGSHLDCIADFMGIHQTTAVRIIRKVTMVIARLYRTYIAMPNTEADQLVLKEEFFHVARFPNIIGALDCTHIKIKSPGGDDAEVFRNRKDFFSVNVQAICDANNKILNVVARWPGSAHDSTIFNSSNVRADFEDGNLQDCILLGDRGYPFKQYLMTPLLNPNTPAEHLYNEAHIRTRNKIECTFGIWKRRFPVLAYGCRLKLETTLGVIVATAILHNIAKMQNEGEPGIDEGMDEQELNNLIAAGNIPNVAANPNDVLGNGYRDQLINQYFARL